MLGLVLLAPVVLLGHPGASAEQHRQREAASTGKVVVALMGARRLVRADAQEEPSLRVVPSSGVSVASTGPAGGSGGRSDDMAGEALVVGSAGGLRTGAAAEERASAHVSIPAGSHVVLREAHGSRDASLRLASFAADELVTEWQRHVGPVGRAAPANVSEEAVVGMVSRALLQPIHEDGGASRGPQLLSPSPPGLNSSSTQPGVGDRMAPTRPAGGGMVSSVLQRRIPLYHGIILGCLSTALFFACWAYKELSTAVPWYSPYREAKRPLDPCLFVGRDSAASVRRWTRFVMRSDGPALHAGVFHAAAAEC